MVSTLVLDGLRLDCESRAGDSTWLRLRPPNLAIDVGRGSTRLSGVERVFLTHGHLDHALGVPFLLSMRAAGGAAPLQVFCPAAIEKALLAMIRSAERLDEREYAFRLRGLSSGERVAVGSDVEIEAFATDHVTSSLGYHLIRRRKRLRGDLAGQSASQLADLRRRGEDLDESWEERWLSCTGDTSAAVFDAHPELFESRVLVVECTFFGDGHAERAARFKHIHLDDLVARKASFANDAIVLYHLSRRHRPADLRRAVRERFAPLTPEVHVVG